MKLLKVVEYFVSFILLGLLIYEITVIILKIISKESFQAINEYKFEEILPATITICPAPAYKSNAPFLSPFEYLENKFTWEETFHQKTLENLKNDSLFKIKRTYAAYYGLCFTIQKLTAEKISDFSFQFVINNTIGKNLHIIHS